MKILVTGSEGYIGSQLVPALAAAGHAVVRFDARLGHDILNQVQLEKEGWDCDWIIHLAGIVGIDLCERDPQRAQAINVDGTINVLRLGKNVIYTSVLAGYKEEEIDEDTPVCPAAVYYKTKVQAEELVRARQQTILRFGALYGVNPYVGINPCFSVGLGTNELKVNSVAMRDDLLIHSFCKEAVRTGKITLFQPGHMRPVTYLKDAIDAIIFVLYHPDMLGVYNVVSQNLRKSMIAETISTYTGCQVVAIAGGDSEGRNYSASTSKLRAKGFIFHTPHLLTTVKEICDWYYWIPGKERQG